MCVCVRACVWVWVCVLAWGGVEGGASCNKTRQVLTDKYGVISDGPGNYSQASHCQWLVKAEAGQHITLNITKMETECSYDHLYIHDGHTFDAPLLGVFSGNTTPPPLTAASGAMLIMLYSDTNYALAGFEAFYFITDCPLNCSGHGKCVSGQCQCDLDFTGPGCEFEHCPDNCGLGQRRGHCAKSPRTLGAPRPAPYCMCSNEYYGDSCSLYDGGDGGDGAFAGEEGAWYWLWRGAGPGRGRTSHAAVYLPHLDQLFVYGGFDLNEALGDLMIFDIRESLWLKPGDPADEELLNRRKKARQTARMTAKERESIRLTATSPQSQTSTRFDHLTFSKSGNNTVSVKRTRRNTPGDAASAGGGGAQEGRPSSPPPSPGPRYGHAMERFGFHFVLFGGKTDKGEVSNELWLYNTTLNAWRLIAPTTTTAKTTSTGQTTAPTTPAGGEETDETSDHPPDPPEPPMDDQPPGLMHASLTLVDEKWIYLFGGSLPHGEFSSLMFRMDLTSLRVWERVLVLGGSELDVRVVGHSTVYHAQTRSLLVYGGIRVNMARFSNLTDQLLIFSIDHQFWSLVQYPRPRGRHSDRHIPLKRAFHSAVIAGTYMVVMGGYVHIHNEDERCYDQEVYLYHLGCHVWVSHKRSHAAGGGGGGGDATGATGSSGQYPRAQGVYGHSLSLRGGNTLLVVAGFQGSVNTQVLAYTLPSTLVSAEGQRFDSDQACRRHTSQEWCVASLGCGWCPADNICYERSRGARCTNNLQTYDCPGLCPALQTCQSCLVHGGGPCSWCVQAGRCTGRDQAAGGWPGRCGADAPLTWWGGLAGEVQTPGDCRGQDRRPGITLVRHFPPVDLKRPDSVSLLNHSWTDLSYREEFSGAMSLLRPGPVVTLLAAFLHTPETGADRGLSLEAKAANASLWVSGDEPGGDEGEAQGRELVAELEAGPTKEAASAKRPDGSQLLTPGGRQLIEAKAWLKPGAAGHLSLSWGGADRGTLSYRHLEPYSQGGAHCLPHDTCLACLTDSLCQWCPKTASCLPRDDPEAACGGGAGQQDPTSPDTPHHFPILDLEECGTCELHIYCSACLAAGCEWVPDNAHCSRWGRFPGAVTVPHNCPPPCHDRLTCASCLGVPGRCAWCSETKECFLFSVYTSVYQYGSCRVWLDEDHTNITAPATTTTTTTAATTATGTTGASMPLLAPTAPPEVLPLPQRLALESAECHVCEAISDCETCVRTLSCGWCHHGHNFTLGLCTEGDFTRPHRGTCQILLEEAATTATTTPSPLTAQGGHVGAEWAYARCPDLDECKLGLDNCHVNATCRNKDPGYDCQCERGFEGDGRKTCERTCYERCVHGYCSGKPDYRCVCQLGWTGVDCSADCGCNNHSTCSISGPGTCDECQDWTTGEHCHLCKPGSYGNATTAQGCQKCQCNSHWDTERGYCDLSTGDCFCLHHTTGHHCHLCLPGYYGDPREGGHCYRECGARTVLTGGGRGHLGAQVGGPDNPSSCLWVINASTLFPPLPPTTQEPPTPPTDSSLPPGSAGGGGDDGDGGDGQQVIQVTIEATNIDCDDGILQIYDDLPQFISGSPTPHAPTGHLVGAFCHNQATFPATVEATSGIMTIYYERNGSQQGFNATYEVLSCPENPGPRRVCVEGRPVCGEGWRGVRCDLPVCPGGCGQGEGRGTCLLGYGRCNCSQGFVGEQCQLEKFEYQVVVSQLVGAARVGPGDPHLATVLQRLGHSLVVDQGGSLWVFGGLSLRRGALNDLQRFDPHNTTSIWQQVTVTLQPGRGKQAPPSRYLHGAAYVPGRGHMYVYGGLNRSHFLGDFWRFSMDSSAWASVPTPAALPPLAGHTLTYRGQQEAASLLLVGGASPQYGFLEAPWEYSVATGRWARLDTSGTAPVGVYGHSAVYHEASGALYVYGGHCFKLHGVALCRDLYALHYARRRWALLSPRPSPATRGPPPPPPRAFHAAVTTPDYMVVLGGQVAAPPAPAHALLAYSYTCNAWLPLAPPNAALVGPALTPPVATAAAATSATAAPPAMYLFGGYNGTALGSLLQVWVPADLCALNANQSQCKSVAGCASCVVVGRGPANASLCYNNAGEEPQLCRAATEKQVVVGVPCAAPSRHDPACEQRESCAACLGDWPPRPDAQQRCQWCHSLARGRCVPRDADCPREEVCQGGGGAGSGCHSVREAEQCQEAACVASDCDKCQGPRACIWTRQVRRRKQVGHYDLQETPSLNWNCVNTTIQQHLSYPVESSPPGSCPERCHRHASCAACLAATGAEGGWHECRWSPALQECLSPSYVPLRCLGGACGLVLAGGPDQCPPPCSAFTQCAQCLAQPRCGWCALPSPVGGLGRCVAGSLRGPDLANCTALDFSDLLAAMQANDSLATLHALPPAGQAPPQPRPSWHYLTCPPEDECRNGHHECRPASQTCRDLPRGYQCVCAAGYNMTAPGHCAPVCSQGCERGTCVLPDVCACHFGYVGANCSTQCLCHGHSNCAGPDQLEVCLQCHNNTTGATCHLCSPRFVGDPAKGVPCVSCSQHCHGHATLCVAPDQAAAAAAAAAAGGNASLAGEEGTEAPEPPPHGPGEDAECVQCANNTAGRRCQTCLEGFFRGSEDLSWGCRPCQCNGHGSTCDAVWGTGCDCGNNTETDKQCLEGGKGRGGAGERDEECWQHQCAKCADAYLGSPSGGHQCYLQMNVDKDYCLDPEGQSQCSSGPAPLPPRRTVFFAVQPKFMNVDIRLVLDVTEGGADVFFSSRGDAFVVTPPRPGAAPVLTIDPQYLRGAGVGGGEDSRRGGGGGGGGGSGGSGDGGNGTVESRLVQREGRGLKTFATVTRAAEILVVRNVTNRLVVTLPQHHHDLRSAKFYLAVQGVGRPGRPLTWGSVFFRQDQPRIDLFVFFSVFFSCFFLFLAVCVVAWKVKQGLDLQRLRRQHMVQMLHMAKRPCAATTLLLHAEDAPEPPVDHTLWSPGRRKRAAKRERDGLQVGPLAVEPTDDGVAAVLTLMVQLPGGGLGGAAPNPHAPTHRLALGSSLCLMSRIFPPASRPFHLRRRTSHLAP